MKIEEVKAKILERKRKEEEKITRYLNSSTSSDRLIAHQEDICQLLDWVLSQFPKTNNQPIIDRPDEKVFKAVI